jgi:hypothetical protein
MALPSRTETLDDLYTSTWNNRKKDVVDQLFKATPVYDYMRKQGAIKFDGTGGRYLEIPLSYAKNDTVTSLSKGDTISINDTAFLTTAQYEWKFVAGSIVRYYTDDAKNKSKSAHFKLIDAKLDNLKRSLVDKFETYMFGDGTGNGGKDPEGLLSLVDPTPATGTVGNINAATYSWWRNQQAAGSGAASIYLLTDMRTMFNNCSKGQATETPNYIVTTQTMYELYEDEVVEQKQIVNKTSGDPEFDSVYFKGVPLMWSSQCTSGYMYFLNTDYISMIVDPDIFFTPTEWKSIPNQLDRVMQIVCKCNIVTSRRASLGVLTGLSA